MVIVAIVPPDGPIVGGNLVTRSGYELGSNDTFSVVLAGTPVAAFTWMSQTRIVALAAASSIPVTGAVVVNSTSYGSVVSHYRYNNRTFSLLWFFFLASNPDLQRQLLPLCARPQDQWLDSTM